MSTSLCIQTMIIERACIDAVAVELQWRREHGEQIPDAVAAVALADVEDAAKRGDGDRLEWLWRNAAGLVGELLEHHRQRGTLTI